MSDQSIDKDLDPKPLVEALVEKTKAGKLHWEETADENIFISSIGGMNTLEVGSHGTGWERTTRLVWRNEYGKILWEIEGGEGATSEARVIGLDSLFDLARRIALRLDERMEALLGTLQNL